MTTIRDLVTDEVLEQAQAFAAAVIAGLGCTPAEAEAVARLLDVRPATDAATGLPALAYPAVWARAWLVVETWLVARGSATPISDAQRVITAAPAGLAWIDASGEWLAETIRVDD